MKTECPKCGRKSVSGNGLVIFCTAAGCDFEVEDLAPLPNDRDERRAMLGLRRIRK